MALTPLAAGVAQGRPATARRWFSNWLVAAPSIVQCPELWTRGAISLAKKPIADLEQLDGEHAHVAERLQHPPGVILGSRLQGRRDALRGREAPPEDSARVEVLDQGIAGDRAVLSPDGEDRELAVEAHEALEDERRLPQPRPRPLGVDGRLDQVLSLAVVARDAGS